MSRKDIFAKLNAHLANYRAQQRQGLRAMLAGTPGLLNRTNQALADSEHAEKTFRNHGITSTERDLMGDKWCTSLVNARCAIDVHFDYLWKKAYHHNRAEIPRDSALNRS